MNNNKTLIVCFEIDGYAVDEHGNPCPAGGRITLEGCDEDADAEAMPLKDLAEALDVPIDRIRYITLEQYEEMYADD